MKKIFGFALAVLALQAVADNTFENIGEVDSIFSIGKFNGKPEKIDSELVKDEFKTLTETGDTVQVKKPEQFPQLLQANQRIAIFLENIEAGTDLLVEASLVVGQDTDLKTIPSIEMRYNSNLFYRERQSSKKKLLQLFIPKTWNEKGVNVLEVRNMGLRPIAFDAFSIRRFLFPALKNVQPAQAELPKKVAGIASSLESASESSNILRDKAARFLPNKIIEYLNEGGGFFSLEEFSGLDDFYDPYTGKPVLAYYVLGAIAPLFEGVPEKVICTIVPIGQDDILTCTKCVAVRNNENTMTVAIATTPEDMKKYAEIILPVPWSGDTELEAISGILPEGIKYSSSWIGKRSLKKDKIAVNGMMFKEKFSMQDLAVFRLVQAGKKAPEPIKFAVKAQDWREPPIERGVFQVLLKHPPSNNILIPLLDIKKAPEPNSPSGNYKTEVIPATKGDIDNIKNVVPWDSKSLKVEICYPEGKPFNEEWAGIRFLQVPEKCSQFSFWVYPRSENSKIQKTSLILYFKNNKDDKYHYFAADLKTGLWQRVVLPVEKYKGIDDFRIAGNPRLPEYKDKNKVSYEFNGFSGIDTVCKPGYSSMRIVSGSESQTLPVQAVDEAVKPEGDKKAKEAKTAIRKTNTAILTGEPGMAFEYRHIFKEPMEFKEIFHLSKDKDISAVWRKDAQILVLKGKFPEGDYQPPEELLKMLTAAEKDSMAKKGTVPIGIKFIGE